MIATILGIDHGLKRCGIAYSSDPYEFVWPLDTVCAKKIHEYLKNIILERNVQEIVVGMPYMLNGSEGEQCRSVRNFIEEIRVYFNKTIHVVDERMTSMMAKKLYSSDLDSSVACIILEMFISQNAKNK